MENQDPDYHLEELLRILSLQHYGDPGNTQLQNPSNPSGYLQNADSGCGSGFFRAKNGATNIATE